MAERQYALEIMRIMEQLDTLMREATDDVAISEGEFADIRHACLRVESVTASARAEFWVKQKARLHQTRRSPNLTPQT